MKFLHFCGGDKGGVGKTFFAKFLINYYMDHNFPLIVYESDSSNLDIIRAFSSKTDTRFTVKKAFFSDNPSLKDAPDVIAHDAITGSSDIVVNLPAGSTSHFFEWWESTGVGELMHERDVKPIYWFLLATEQIERLQKFVLRTDLTTVIVCNSYLQPEWDSIIDLIKTKLSPLGVDPASLKFFKLEYLSQSVSVLLARKRWLVSTALREEGDDKLKLLEAKRLQVYLKNFNQSLISTGCVPQPPS